MDMQWFYLHSSLISISVMHMGSIVIEPNVPKYLFHHLEAVPSYKVEMHWTGNF